MGMIPPKLPPRETWHFKVPADLRYRRWFGGGGDSFPPWWFIPLAFILFW